MELNRSFNLLPENIVNPAAVVTTEVRLPLTVNNDITLAVLRLDKIDPVISGNKWFKLKYYLGEALQNGRQRVLTFGGPYSNHIVAAACATHKAGLQSIGIIRGEKPAILSPSLVEAAHWGMQLVFVSRDVYNQKKDPAFIDQLRQTYGDPLIIPEGGEGAAGVKGAAEILKLAGPELYTHIVCAVGTGTLLSGLAVSAAENQVVTGIPVLKGFDDWSPAFLNAKEKARTAIIGGYHFGGYAKKTGPLITFMNDWYAQTNIPSDFVYTGKLFFAVTDLVEKGFFAKGSRLLIIHSGGLQGNRSLAPKTLDF